MDGEDGWTYSLPPSSEFLPLTAETRHPAPPAPVPINPQITPTDPQHYPAERDSPLPSPELPPLAVVSLGEGADEITPENDPENDAENWQLAPIIGSDSVDTRESLLGLSEALGLAVPLRNPARDGPSEVSDLLKRPSLAGLENRFPLTSGLLQSANILKLAPADPHTTKKDASLVISKENKTNALAGSKSPPTSPVSKDFHSSIRIWQQSTMDNDEDPASPVSPKIITYRKSTHSRKESLSLLLLELAEKFDPRLYVAEKFADTPYHYATMKRNVDFHLLFKSLDLTDRLLDDFACAVSREILLQGRVYITEQNVCFNSNLLGWVTSISVPFADITRIDKKSTAGLFPNGITIETKSAKHSFASFLSRDTTYDFIRTVWLASTGKSFGVLDSAHHVDEPDESDALERRISSYIMSIDEDDHVDDKWNDHSDSSDSSKPLVSVQPPALGAHYINKGPQTHGPTTIETTYDLSQDEIEVCREVLDGPLGLVFEILFGTENQAFHRKVLEDQGALEISEYGKFLPSGSDSKTLERSFTYQRPLGFLIGPKSTKCCIDELIEHLDYNHLIVVLSTTTTPDVPSGGSFSVRTRYYMTWGPENKTILQIAYFVNWTGRSWIKNVVEKLTRTTQFTVAKKVVDDLRQELEREVELGGGSLVMGAMEATSEKPELRKLEVQQKPLPVVAVRSRSLPFSTNTLVVGVAVLTVLMMLVLQYQMLLALRETKAVIQKQLELLAVLGAVAGMPG